MNATTATETCRHFLGRGGTLYRLTDNRGDEVHRCRIPGCDYGMPTERRERGDNGLFASVANAPEPATESSQVDVLADMDAPPPQPRVFDPSRLFPDLLDAWADYQAGRPVSPSSLQELLDAGAQIPESALAEAWDRLRASMAKK